MALFKTPEEKAAIQAEKDRVAAQEAAAAQERRRVEAAHAAALPKWEYLVFDIGAGDRSTPQSLQAKLDSAARSGWRAVSITALQINMSSSGYGDQVLRVAMERPAPGAGHTGHPVAVGTRA